MRRWLTIGSVLVATAAALVAVPPAGARPATGGSPAVGGKGVAAPAALTSGQRTLLRGIARDTWRFFAQDVDAKTHLPLDNVGPGATRGQYTSAANVGVYLWAVVAARDLGLITGTEATARVRATLGEIRQLPRSHGFLYQWYDTATGHVIVNPGQGGCPQVGGTSDNCSFLSAVDNGWYVAGLVVARHALPGVAPLADSLLGDTDFSIFYDSGPQTECNETTGQMYGGYYAGVGPAGYHNGAIFSDPRIALYLGIGRHQMPGDVWWRTWRVLPPQRCPSDPDFSWQGQPQGPATGTWATIADPQSGRPFTVWEGHYTYPGRGLRFLPTWAGGMFEAMMADQVVPETSWAPRGLGLADRRTVQVQIDYATEALHYPVWGLSPSSTADDTGGYGSFGVEGQAFPIGQQLSQCTTCGTETTVTPHASFLALDAAPQAAVSNIAALRRIYPDVYAADGGFYDAVDPTTGTVGHRRLVLDQSMIMAALDNALNGRQLQRWFAADPAATVDRAYLAAETLGL